MWRLFHFCTYLVFRLFLGLQRFVPISLVFLAGRCGGDIAYCLLWKRRRLALVNLGRAFGEQKTKAGLRALNREHFRRLGANLLCSFKVATMTRSAVLQRVTIEMPATLNVPPEGKRTGWVAMISHLGNWELFGQLTALFPDYKYGAIYQKLANPHIDRYLREIRVRAAVILFERKEGFLRSVDFLREGGAIGVLVDQSAGYAGLWTPFFGRLASCSTLAATLATRAEVPIVPIAIYTSGLARWHVAVSEPIDCGCDPIEEVTARINRELESQIIESPADWLWSHNRWKPLRPHFLMELDQRRYYFPPDCDRNTLEPFRILVQSPGSLPQARSSLPAVRAIKAGRPDIFLAIITTSSLAGFWENVSEVDQVIQSRESCCPSLPEIRALQCFDAAIVLSASFWLALKVFLAGIPIRVGPSGTFGTCFYNQYLPEPPPDSANETLAYLQVAQSVGANINPDLVALHSDSLKVQ